MNKLQSVEALVFGPVPSRRLGKSMGINNIPPKTCSYSCVYCQLGKTNKLVVKRKAFYKPEDIFKEVKKKIEMTTLKNEKVDYLTFVPDGEPTLDVNIGKEILLLKRLNIPVAVMTNASLLWRDDVRKDLLEADLISLKIDSLSLDLWRRINRPHKDLSLNMVIDGIIKFTNEFQGTIISETMLINNISYNDEFKKIAKFLKKLNRLKKAYIAIPIRPPTEKWVKPTKEKTINFAYQVFSKILGVEKVELLVSYEGSNFTFTENVKRDLLSILAVHPMRKEAIEEFLKKANKDWSIIEELLHENKLVELEYEGNIYYMQKFTQ